MEGVIALYIVMLAAFTGYEIIAKRAGDPAHAADVRQQLRARHRAGRRHGRARPRRHVLEQVIGFIGVVLGAGNAVGGYVVTERMLQMFKASGQKKRLGVRLMSGLLPENVATLAIDFGTCWSPSCSSWASRP